MELEDTGNPESVDVQSEFSAEREHVDTMEFGILVLQPQHGQYFGLSRGAFEAADDLPMTPLRKLNVSFLPHVTSDCELVVTSSHFGLRKCGSWRHLMEFERSELLMFRTTDQNLKHPEAVDVETC